MNYGASSSRICMHPTSDASQISVIQSGFKLKASIEEDQVDG
eukprot:CAMPEP_0115829118 /NCGR_PEP_ID=MMETSP0287-20121206/933_1 /TAXON_ID=412157 /ORGANISM="Chrysochromulina rotalis, Strain UIO044" /LENGTH=41 /DNA_ID= /DNA_START= /DNA_END= /DNA_ORIENTATION=